MEDLNLDEITSSDEAFEGILEMENFAQMLEALKNHFQGLGKDQVPQRARKVYESLRETDTETLEMFLDFLYDKKLITKELYVELAHKGPSAGSQGIHSDTHMGDITKTGL